MCSCANCARSWPWPRAARITSKPCGVAVTCCARPQTKNKRRYRGDASHCGIAATHERSTMNSDQVRQRAEKSFKQEEHAHDSRKAVTEYEARSRHSRKDRTFQSSSTGKGSTVLPQSQPSPLRSLSLPATSISNLRERMSEGSRNSLMRMGFRSPQAAPAPPAMRQAISVPPRKRRSPNSRRRRYLTCYGLLRSQDACIHDRHFAIRVSASAIRLLNRSAIHPQPGAWQNRRRRANPTAVSQCTWVPISKLRARFSGK